MKKAKLLALALSVAITAMGAGYAAWNDTVTLNNNVRTGNLSVEFVKEGIYPYAGAWEQDFSDPNNVTSRPSTTVKSEITHGRKITYYKLNNLIPGSWGVFEAKIKNLGSIPAKGNNIQVIFDEGSSPYLLENILVIGKIFHYRPNPDGTATPQNSASIMNVKLKNLETAINSSITGWELQPGDFITFDVDDQFKQEIATVIKGYDIKSQNSLYYWLPFEAGNNTMDQSVGFQIHLNFKQ